MKVLVLVNGTEERSLIQNALEKGGHRMVLAGSAQEALGLIEAEQIRLVILDNDATNIPAEGFIQSVRASRLPVYFLALVSGDTYPEHSDDSLRRPFTVVELQTRINIGFRFLSLGESLSQAHSQIENLAMFDGLTGLFNRKAFYLTTQGELERARRASAALSVIALDIDNFKALNETHGAEVGDEVLKATAQTIREKSRPYDCLGRWSGDEFLIALPGVIGTDAEKIADRIIKGIRSVQIKSKSGMLGIEVSAGIASISTISAATEVDPLIQQALQAMMRAKESGDNQVNLTYL